MKHLVTGGSGFVGNFIARRLAARGEEVTVFDLWEDSSRPAEIRFLRGDVCDPKSVAGAMKGIDVVHHNAACVPLTKSLSGFEKVNVNGSRIVAEAAVRARIKYFIYTSSSAIFGIPPEVPITENTPAKPIEGYGRTKWEGECAVREIAEKGGMRLFVFRPRTVLGEGRLGIFQILFERVRSGRDIYIIGNGSNKFQFIHVEDLLDAYFAALDSQKPGIYNVGTDRFGTLRDCLGNLVRFAGSRSRIRPLPTRIAIPVLTALDFLKLSPLSPWQYRTYHIDFYFDLSGISALGWKPRYSNDEMMCESYAWYLRNRMSLKSPGQSSHRRGVKERIISLMR